MYLLAPEAAGPSAWLLRVCQRTWPGCCSWTTLVWDHRLDSLRLIQQAAGEGDHTWCPRVLSRMLFWWGTDQVSWLSSPRVFSLCNLLSCSPFAPKARSPVHWEMRTVVESSISGLLDAAFKGHLKDVGRWDLSGCAKALRSRPAEQSQQQCQVSFGLTISSASGSAVLLSQPSSLVACPLPKPHLTPAGGLA